jgi:hypothetical protein
MAKSVKADFGGDRKYNVFSTFWILTSEFCILF